MSKTRKLSINYLNSLSDETLLELKHNVTALLTARKKELAPEKANARIKLLTLSYAHRFYIPHKPDPEEKAVMLLSFVKQGKYNDINKLLNENPAYMFIEVKDERGATTTPLKTAIVNLDEAVYYDIFLSKIANNQEWLREYVTQYFDQYETALVTIVWLDSLNVWKHDGANGSLHLLSTIISGEKALEQLRELLPLNLVRSFIDIANRDPTISGSEVLDRLYELKKGSTHEIALKLKTVADHFSIIDNNQRTSPTPK